MAVAKKSIIAMTLLHTLEVGVLFAVVFGLAYLFGIDSEWVKGAVGLLLVAVAKYARASETSPIADYVNK